MRRRGEWKSLFSFSPFPNSSSCFYEASFQRLKSSRKVKKKLVLHFHEKENQSYSISSYKSFFFFSWKDERDRCSFISKQLTLFSSSGCSKTDCEPTIQTKSGSENKVWRSEEELKYVDENIFSFCMFCARETFRKNWYYGPNIYAVSNKLFFFL